MNLVEAGLVQLRRGESGEGLVGGVWWGFASLFGIASLGVVESGRDWTRLQ